MAYDVIVIGGGITGAGLLRDLALRGLRCLLVEKGEPGRGTTVNSSHLIHGGLRYLLYDRLTTHASCWDSGHILRIAGPLLTRLPVLWPVYRGHQHGLETVETLLESYDGFQKMKGGLPHMRLSPAETSRLLPALRAEGLRGAVVFDEWWVDPLALVEANLKSARAAGGELRAGARAVAVHPGEPMRVELEAGGRRETVESRLVVNAAGPWADEVARLAGADVPLRRQKGTHLVYGDPAAVMGPTPRRLGLLLEARDRERYVFVVPGADGTLVGPTDIAAPEPPDRLASTPEEIEYLLASVRRYFPAMSERYARTIVGARPILGQPGSEKLLSRDYRVFDHAAEGRAGFLTIAGGKMSDFRLMAEEAADAACRRLGHAAASRTHELPLVGGAADPGPEFPPPPRRLRRFLNMHPRLRELHSLAYLGAGLARHATRRVLSRRDGTLEGFLERYG